jgi:hypothetical protein
MTFWCEVHGEYQAAVKVCPRCARPEPIMKKELKKVNKLIKELQEERYGQRNKD